MGSPATEPVNWEWGDQRVVFKDLIEKIVRTPEDQPKGKEPRPKLDPKLPESA